MKFFIDTADISEIKEADAMGIIDGVTTNPSLVARTGRSFREVLLEAAKIGAHVCTCPLEVLLHLTHHPLTDSGLTQFLKDWEKVPK